MNSLGLRPPHVTDEDKQVPCFKGKTTKTFLELLDEHLEHGYPLGDEASEVHDPYLAVRAHSADGTCVLAYAVKQLLSDGFSLYDIEQHTSEAYTAFIDFIKTRADFQGVSGQVKFSGNDKAAYLGVQQVREGSTVLVGTCSHNSTIDLTVNGGPSNASWQPAFPDVLPAEAHFPYWAFQVFLPILCICCPALAACIRNF